MKEMRDESQASGIEVQHLDMKERERMDDAVTHSCSSTSRGIVATISQVE